MQRAAMNLSMQVKSAASPLATLVSCLRALYQLHQSHHWTSKGSSYYSDHLLYQRLYEAILPEIDSVAERAVGMGGLELLRPIPQARQTASFVELFCEGGPKAHVSSYSLVGAHFDPYQLASRSLQAELFTIGLIDDTESAGVSAGTRNLLEGIADLHETHIYLLNQRLSQV